MLHNDAANYEFCFCLVAKIVVVNASKHISDNLLPLYLVEINT